jgi:hypothetical protein
VEGAKSMITFVMIPLVQIILLNSKASELFSLHQHQAQWCLKMIFQRMTWALARSEAVVAVESMIWIGMVIQSGKQTSSQDKISSGNVGVAAVSFGDKTVATLVNDKITGATIPTQELSCCGGTAEIVTVPPGGFKVSKSQLIVKSSQVEKLLEQKLRR